MYLRYFFCFASRRRHTRCALVTGVQTCALPFCGTVEGEVVRFADLDALKAAPDGSLAGKIAFVDYQMKRRRDGGDYRNAGGVRWGGPSAAIRKGAKAFLMRSEEHTSELQSLMRISYAGFCLKKKKKTKIQNNNKSIRIVS